MVHLWKREWYPVKWANIPTLHEIRADCMKLIELSPSEVCPTRQLTHDVVGYPGGTVEEFHWNSYLELASFRLLAETDEIQPIWYYCHEANRAHWILPMQAYPGISAEWRSNGVDCDKVAVLRKWLDANFAPKITYRRKVDGNSQQS